jgi:plasmid stabilization system protein ParE
MQTVWSDDALIDYNQNIDYLLKEWSERVALEFVEDVETTIELIKDFPELYPLTEYLGVRKALVRKQITLFYRIKDNEIHLIRFWNNYQDPKRLKL